MSGFMKELENQIYNTKLNKKRPQMVTQPEPFNLNQPVARKILLPEIVNIYRTYRI